MLRNFGTQDGELYKPDSMEMGGGDSSKSDDKGAPSFGGGGFDFSNMPEMGDFDMSNMPDMGSFDFGSMLDNGNFDFGNMPEKDSEEAPSEENSEDKDSKSSFGGGQGGFGGGKGGFPGGGGFNFDSENMPDMGDFDMSNMPDMGDFDFGSMPENRNFDFGNMPEKGSEEAPSEDSSEDKDSKPSPGGGGFPGGGGGFSGGGGGFSFGSGGANLNYTDDDLDSYSTIWDGEVTGTSKADHKRVVTALKNISEGKDIEEYLDVDNVLKYMAVHTFSVNMDSLSGSMAHNYYLYEYDGKLNIFPWDYNLSLGGMSMGGGSDGTSVVNDAIDTPFSGTQFFDALLENEEYLAKYHEYLDMLVEEYVNGGRFDEVYSRIRSQIDSLVEEDPTAFYDYDEYETAAETLYETIKLRAESIRGQ
ncbi:MAG: CotH kinase family protein, partial [Lachnospiraceae bacterium]|nr:CotH kinase family protein [Lachnospiraceae bacterium]